MPSSSYNYENAHAFSYNHRDEIEASHRCGCFYCMAIFTPSEIEEWVDADDHTSEGDTALCPRCGNDSVLGDQSGYPIKKEFLENMNKVWFQECA